LLTRNLKRLPLDARNRHEEDEVAIAIPNTIVEFNASFRNPFALSY